MKNQDLNIDPRDPKHAYDNAIKLSVLSANESAENYAGHYMYMYSADGSDFFKHCDTRQYIEVKVGGAK